MGWLDERLRSAIKEGNQGVVGKTHLIDGARLIERRGRGGRLGKA
jgi:hypothetical protein